jgi:hypothetical protein
MGMRPKSGCSLWVSVQNLAAHFGFEIWVSVQNLAAHFGVSFGVRFGYESKIWLLTLA